MTERNNRKEQTSSALDPKLKASLNNTAWQRGLTWRNEKVNAVAEARRKGISEQEIFRQLKIAGLIDATARAIMKDASYLEGEDFAELTHEQLQEELDEENQNNIALGKKPYTMKQWREIRKPRMKVE
jgi:uncharacterized protein (DUF433 family)